MMNLALRSNGTVEVTASTAGYVQPGTVSVMRGTFGRASASGRAYLYGNCGDPNNLATCVYYSVGAVTARWRSTSVATSWNETKNVTNAGSSYILKTSRARGRRWRQAWLCSGAAFGNLAGFRPSLRHQHQPECHLSRALPEIGTAACANRNSLLSKARRSFCHRFSRTCIYRMRIHGNA